MAFRHGRQTVLNVNGQDISAYTRESDFDRGLDNHDVTAYGQNGHRYRGGLTDGTFSCSGTYDDTASTGPGDVLEPLLEDRDGVTVVFQPEGTGAGLAQRSFNGLLTSYSVSSPVDDMITWEAEFQIDGDVDRAAQV